MFVIKHIKLSNVKSVEQIDEKITHIKTTPYKGGRIHLYWNKHRSELIVGNKVELPVRSIAHLMRCKQDFSDTERNEIQLGDSVCYIFAKEFLPIYCATVLGYQIYAKKRFYFLEANDPHCPIPHTWVEFDKNRFFLVSSNRTKRRFSVKNRVFAYYQDELETVERIYSTIRSEKVIREYLTSTKYLGESAFKYCHHSLFNGIYSWAGQYRKDEVVVTNRNFPTMHPSDIEEAMNKFCRGFASKYLKLINNDKTKMVEALTFAHSQLAWIHPFSDGNGRTMRLYLELVARTRGFDFNLKKAISTLSNKRYYHYAVRRAINRDSKHLKSIIFNAIN
jgi:cell filamentation protein